MNTPKPFAPVVPMPEPATKARSFYDAGYLVECPDYYTFDQLRAYAAEVARACVPDETWLDERFAGGASSTRLSGFVACRAATLSAIDEWEKNDE